MILIASILLVFVFLCWGSFLNVAGYRLVREASLIKPRSHCPHCKHKLAWYDLIPAISWILLLGKCRYCQHTISILYPFIELATALSLSALLYIINVHYFFAYFIFFSALIITIRTDVETMLISRFVTLFLVPAGFLFSTLHLLPISIIESLIGAIFGYGILYLIGTVFSYRTGIAGLGQGDLDLLCFIGSFTGIYGCWITLLIGSITGSIFGIIYMIIYKPNARKLQIPFGPFLAMGAIIYVLFQKPLLYHILNVKSCA